MNMRASGPVLRSALSTINRQSARLDMGHDWILDVLTDLKAYARANGLPTLAEHLDDACLVAHVEMSSLGKGANGGVSTLDTRAGGAPRAVGDC